MTPACVLDSNKQSVSLCMHDGVELSRHELPTWRWMCCWQFIAAPVSRSCKYLCSYNASFSK